MARRPRGTGRAGRLSDRGARGAAPPRRLAGGAGRDHAHGRRDRVVAALEPRPGAGAGEVELGFFEYEDEELDFVADTLAAQYEAARAAGEPFNAAVLVRANKTSPEVAEALDERGVPFEAAFLGGDLSFRL